MDHANRETFLVVQIETPEAVRNVEAIAAIEGVDGLFIGPGDLGVRLRRVGAEFTLDEAFQRVAAAAKKYGKAWGSPALSPDHLRYLHNAGAQLIANGGDYVALLGFLQQKAGEFDEVFGKRPG
jgi:4-hydroxy-2-oxoheptanedioate aldolase